MIDRYSRKELRKIWDEKNKYQIWLNIEIAATQAMEKLKLVPRGVAKKIRRKATINVGRIHKIESKVHHDVIAFLTSITEKVGPEGRFLHKGMTSSDVLDTCFNIQLLQAGKIILKDIDEILKVLKNKSLKYKKTICVGRSHGIHAEPTTFGLKLASYYEEFKRNKRRIKNAIDEISTCAISGAVGTFANIDPKVESYVAKVPTAPEIAHVEISSIAFFILLLFLLNSS
jgi:adenylosuccinate lyase